MVVAKSERAYTELKRAFHDREVDKIYHAVVQGHPDPLSGTIDAPIGRHPSSSWKFAVVADGKPSRHPLRHARGDARPRRLLEIHLETGRTHQIRVHMAAQRHPCVGDLLYGADPDARPRGSGSRGSGCTPCGSDSGIRRPASTSNSRRAIPQDLQHALDVFAATDAAISLGSRTPGETLVEQRFLRAPARAQRVLDARRRRPGRRPHDGRGRAGDAGDRASPTTATCSAPTTSGSRRPPRASSRSSAPRPTSRPGTAPRRQDPRALGQRRRGRRLGLGRLHPHDAARPRTPRACTTCSGCRRSRRSRATTSSRAWTASC